MESKDCQPRTNHGVKIRGMEKNGEILYPRRGKLLTTHSTTIADDPRHHCLQDRSGVDGEPSRKTYEEGNRLIGPERSGVLQ